MTHAQPESASMEYGLEWMWQNHFPPPPFLPSGDELPYEDGIPLESHWHRLQMNLLIELIEYHLRDRRDFFAGGNMFLYFDPEHALTQNFRGPDVFLVKNARLKPARKSWVAWEEDWKLPNVIVELTSSSTIGIDLTDKKRLYEQVFQTPEYFCYDPEKLKLYGWRLKRGVYAPIPMDARGRMVSREMGVKIGLWHGEHFRCPAHWLRLYTLDGRLVPKFSEAEAMRAQAEAMRAADADRRAQAEAERAQAEAERAAAADRRAETESQKAALLEQELLRIKALMAEKGLNADGK